LSSVVLHSQYSMRSALLSVSDRTGFFFLFCALLKSGNVPWIVLLSFLVSIGLVPLARSLLSKQFQLIATDGTAEVLRQSAIDCVRVSDLTGWPEMLGGRVKSLHPALFGAILADRDNKQHVSDMTSHKLRDIRVVAVNLYPFSSVTPKHDINDAVALMDIGGVACLRAAGKNFKHV
jgi:phosphoribosylaminoimidazolecarboxamide formyltransferase/IMP cyclohydrolase